MPGSPAPTVDERRTKIGEADYFRIFPAPGAGCCGGFDLRRGPAPRSLTYWGWIYTVNCLKANLDEFNKAYPDIKVTFKTLSPARYLLETTRALSTGIGLPDVVALEDSHLPAMASTGGLLDLAGRAGAYRDKFNPYKWAAVSAGSRLYAMPWDSGPVAVYYRRDLFARAGFPSAPEAVAGLLDTWDDYYKTAKMIKEKTGAIMFALAGNSNDGRLFEILLQQQGLGYFDRTGNVIVDSPGAVKTLEFLGKMYKDGLTQDSVALGGSLVRGDQGRIRRHR